MSGRQSVRNRSGYVGRGTAKKGSSNKNSNTITLLLFGPICIVFGCWLLWSNERWTLMTYRSIDEASDAAIHVEDIGTQIFAPSTTNNDGDNDDDNLDGRLIHVTGSLTTTPVSGIVDPLFDVRRTNVKSIQRKVEIYQWVETIKIQKVKKGDKEDEIEIASYKRQWVPSPIDSSAFRRPTNHENTFVDTDDGEVMPELPVESKRFDAESIHLVKKTTSADQDNDNQRLHSLMLSPELVKQIYKTNEINIEHVMTLPPGSIKGQSTNAIYFPSRQQRANERNSKGTHKNDDPMGIRYLKNRIKETTVRLDGEERIMYVDTVTGESYSTNDKAMVRIIESPPYIEETTVRFDGQDRTMYVVKFTGDQYSNKDKAVEAVMALLESHQQLPSDTEKNEVDQLDDDNSLTMDEQKPNIGDVRVTFVEVPCDVVTILARLSNKKLHPWRTSQGVGYDIAILSYGDDISIEDMLTNARTLNAIKTRALQALGWILVVVGYSMITNSISTLAAKILTWIPIVGGAITDFVDWSMTIASLVLGTCTSLVVVSVAWMYYRPIVGIALLLSVVGILTVISRFVSKEKQTHETKEKTQ